MLPYLYIYVIATTVVHRCRRSLLAYCVIISVSTLGGKKLIIVLTTMKFNVTDNGRILKSFTYAKMDHYLQK
jgi:hypothetical protein